MIVLIGISISGKKRDMESNLIFENIAFFRMEKELCSELIVDEGVRRFLGLQ